MDKRQRETEIQRQIQKVTYNDGALNKDQTKFVCMCVCVFESVVL